MGTNYTVGIPLTAGVPQRLNAKVHYVLTPDFSLASYVDLHFRGMPSGTGWISWQVYLNNLEIDGEIFDLIVEEAGGSTYLNLVPGIGETPIPQFLSEAGTYFVGAESYNALTANGTAKTDTAGVTTKNNSPGRVFYSLACAGPLTTGTDQAYVAIYDSTAGKYLAICPAGFSMSGEIEVAPNHLIKIEYLNSDTVAHWQTATTYLTSAF